MGPKDDSGAPESAFSDNDFLKGRAKFCHENGGNKYMRLLVERLLEAYESADKMCDYLDAGKRDKRAIREEVISAIRDAGGRFIKVNKDRECIEEVCDMRSIHEIVVEQFRTARRRLQNNNGGCAIDTAEQHTPTTNNRKVTPNVGIQALEASAEVREFVTRVSDELESNSAESPDSEVSDVPPIDELDSLGPLTLDRTHSADLDLVSTTANSMAGLSSSLSLNFPPPPLSHATRTVSTDLMSLEDLMSHISLGLATRVSNQESHMQTATIADTIGTFGTMSKHSTTLSQVPPQSLSRMFDAPKEIFDSSVLRDHDEIDEIPQLVRRNLQNESVLMDLMDGLLSYTLDEDNEVLMDLAESRVHHLLIDIVRLYPFNCDLQRDGLYALGNLAINDSNQVAIAKAGGINLAMGAMLRFESNHHVLRTACHLLGNLSKNMDNNATVAQSGGISLVACTMKKFPTDELVQRNGCHAIGNLARNIQNNVAIEQAGALTLVLDAMKQFPTIDQLQWYGCLLLAHVTYERDEDRLQAIADGGGIDQLLTAMRAFLTTNERIVRYGCCALGNFAVADTNKVLIADKGGIEAILAVMNLHRTSERGQLYGCFALGTLAENESNRALICKLNGIKVIVDAAKTFPRNEELLDEACYALCNLATSPDDCLSKLVGSNGETLAEDVYAIMARRPSASRRNFRHLHQFSEFL